MTSISASIAAYTPPVVQAPVATAPTPPTPAPVVTSTPNPSPGPAITADKQGTNPQDLSDGPTSSTNTVASNSNDNAPAIYTALAGASTSNIRGTNVNTSA